MTPSDGMTSGNVNGSSKDDVLRSPLAKRKKLAAERTGYSRLKVAFTAAEVQGQGVRVVSSASSGMGEADEDDGDDEEDEDEEDEEEDDFLARDLQEEWG
jgi:RNA polymerase II subunit A-like phosphatase